MDIDCDGNQTIINGDTRCGNSGDTQSETSFMDTVAGYGKGIKDLNANVHMYVVFGNTGMFNSSPLTFRELANEWINRDIKRV